jgi:aerobic-type carbon monoxide dehydrogenase small subunit (CoxS/CutS family)
MPQEYRSVEITVNGLTYHRQVEPRKLLSDFLREDLDLRGTHVGCEHGICGACTVLMNGHTVRSCLMFAVQANGAEITTIEGLAKNGELHPLQQGFWENHGLQCGFCTPGFLMSACECRCTGYQGIVESVLAAAAKMKAQE